MSDNTTNMMSSIALARHREAKRKWALHLDNCSICWRSWSVGETHRCGWGRLLEQGAEADVAAAA